MEPERTLTMVRTDPDAEAAPKPAAQVVTLPASREASAWLKATANLRDAAEREVSDAQAVYDAAKDRLKAARHQLAVMRQLTEMVQASGAPIPLALPKPVRAGRWARDWAACRVCGSTASKHGSGGSCKRCDGHKRKYGAEWPNKETQHDGTR